MSTKNKSNTPRIKSSVKAYKFLGSTRNKSAATGIARKVLSTTQKVYSGQKIVSPTRNKLNHTDEDALSYSVADQRYWDKQMEELTFGRTIRAYRLCEDWSLTDAAEKIGISVQQLSDYEHGRKLPSIERAYSIAKALGMMPQGVVIQLLNEQLDRAKIALRVKAA